MLIIASVFLLLWATVAGAQWRVFTAEVQEEVVVEPQPPNWNPQNREHIKDYIHYVGSREGVSIQTLLAVANCESGFNPNAWNKQDPNGGSKGVMQFQERTFYGFAKMYNIDNPDIWNPFQQINLATYMIRDGHGSHWTCYRKYMALNTQPLT